MKRTHRRLVAATATLLGVAAVVAGTVTVASAHDQPDRTGLQRGLDEIVRAGAVGALVEVRDDDGVWRGASGHSQLGKPQGVPVGSRFRAGSITKTFVATVVLQLVDEGRLRLTDSVEKWLPGVVPAGEHITVEELLNHTSGLYDVLHTLTFPPSPEFLTYRDRIWTANELIQRALANPPTVPKPGTEFSYSNTNYLLLGEIIEKVSGRSYGEQIERRILRPLGLNGTTVPGTSARIPGPHPHGYVPVAENGRTRLVDFTDMNPSIMGAGGEIISTTADLNRFFAALLGGRLVPEHLLTQMTTAGTEGGRYGLGMFLKTTTCGTPVYGHDGDAVAYQSWSYSTKDSRRQVTIALTPNFHGDLDDKVDAYLDEVFCG